MRQPTNCEVREALRGSIEKWEGIANGSLKDEGASNCPLCKMFLLGLYGRYCIGCPIQIDTGRDMCVGSQYMEWVLSFPWQTNLTSARPHFTYARTKKQFAAARAMVRYLKRLDVKFFVKGVTP